MSEVEKPVLSGGEYQTLKAHAPTLARIREVGQPFRLMDMQDTRWRSLKRHGIVRPASKIQYDTTDHGGWYHLWELRDDVEDAVDHILETTPHLPCGRGHTGWRTVEAGETYVCRHCGAEHDRETIERLEAKR